MKRAWRALPRWMRFPITAGFVLLAGIVCGWLLAVLVPLWMIAVLIVGQRRGHSAAASAEVDDKIRWLLVEHCMEDTPANRARLMQLRWAYPKAKKR